MVKFDKFTGGPKRRIMLSLEEEVIEKLNSLKPDDISTQEAIRQLVTQTMSKSKALDLSIKDAGKRKRLMLCMDGNAVSHLESRLPSDFSLPEAIRIIVTKAISN